MKLSLYTITKIPVFIALYHVIHMIKFYTLPNGGTIDLGLVILVLFASTSRPRSLIFFLLGIIILTPLFETVYIITPTQYLLDYILPFLPLFAFSFVFQKTKTIHTKISFTLCLWLFLFIGSFTSHVLSGLIFFESNLTASLLYNASYLIPSFLLSFAIVLFLHSSKTLLRMLDHSKDEG